MCIYKHTNSVSYSVSYTEVSFGYKVTDVQIQSEVGGLSASCPTRSAGKLAMTCVSPSPGSYKDVSRNLLSPEFLMVKVKFKMK